MQMGNAVQHRRLICYNWKGRPIYKTTQIGPNDLDTSKKKYDWQNYKEPPKKGANWSSHAKVNNPRFLNIYKTAILNGVNRYRNTPLFIHYSFIVHSVHLVTSRVKYRNRIRWHKATRSLPRASLEPGSLMAVCRDLHQCTWQLCRALLQLPPPPHCRTSHPLFLPTDAPLSVYLTENKGQWWKQSYVKQWYMRGLGSTI